MEIPYTWYATCPTFEMDEIDQLFKTFTVKKFGRNKRKCLIVRHQVDRNIVKGIYR